MEILYALAKENNADIVISGYINVKENDTFIPDEWNKNANIVTRGETYRKMFLQEEIDVGACAKLYRRELFETLRYPIGELYEDIKVIDDIIEECDVIVCADYKGYYYLQRTGSIIYRIGTKESLSLIDTVKDLVDFMREKYPDSYEAALIRYIYCCFHILGRTIFNKELEAESSDIRRKILKHKNFIYKNDKISRKEKIATWCLNAGLEFYKFFWCFFCFINGKRFI